MSVKKTKQAKKSNGERDAKHPKGQSTHGKGSRELRAWYEEQYNAMCQTTLTATISDTDQQDGVSAWIHATEPTELPTRSRCITIVNAGNACAEMIKAIGEAMNTACGMTSAIFEPFGSNQTVNGITHIRDNPFSSGD